MSDEINTSKFVEFLKERWKPITIGLIIGLVFLCIKIWMMYNNVINDYNVLVDLFNNCKANETLNIMGIF